MAYLLRAVSLSSIKDFFSRKKSENSKYLNRILVKTLSFFKAITYTKLLPIIVALCER